MSIDSLWFDRYQRFSKAAELLRSLAAGRRLSVLDIGSFDNAFAAFLPEHRVTASSEKISAKHGGLSHSDNSVDITVALDVLEHVAGKDRFFFIKEMARVSRLGIVLGFPVAQAAYAEEYVLKITGSVWLREHKKHGLPDPAEIEEMLENLHMDFKRYPNAALPSWTAMMLLMHGVQDLSLKKELSTFFNRHFYALENREPAYRYIYLCRFKKNQVSEA